MLHSLLKTWFGLVDQWGYAGIFLMMAIESTVFPLPSEVVVPPAAYYVAQGQLSFWGIVAASTLGSWAGSALSYAVARAVGRPLILRYGRYVFVPEKKWLLAEAWILHYSAAGVFFAQLLPIVRHVVSLPAGAARMRYRTFSISFLLGSLIECSVLAWFGAHVLGTEKDLLSNPHKLRGLVEAKLWWLIAAAVVLVMLYVIMDTLGRRAKAAVKARG